MIIQSNTNTENINTGKYHVNVMMLTDLSYLFQPPRFIYLYQNASELRLNFQNKKEKEKKKNMNIDVGWRASEW